jgi:hypothetical protein
MTKQDFTDIMVRLGKIDSGIEAVNKRLDISNGRLSKHDDIITKLASDENYQRGRVSGISTFWKIVVTVLTLIIAILAIAAKSGCFGILCR